MPLNIQGSGLHLDRNIAMVDDGQYLWIAGSISSMPDITTGSESVITAGSIQTYNPIGIGSTLVTNLGDLGSNITGSITITNDVIPISGIVNQGTSPWAVSGNSLGVSGTAFNTVWLGIGSNLITNFEDLGSSVIITNFDDIGSRRIITAGSVNINNFSDLGSSVVVTNNVGVTQQTSPWIVFGSVNIDNFADIGSIEIQTVTFTNGSIQPYNPIGIGSNLITNFNELGSSVVVTNFNDIGSESVITAGSILNYEVSPNDLSQNNSLNKFEYVISGTATGVTGSEIGSIIQFIGAGSFVQVFSWTNNLVTQIGSWV